MRMLGAGRDFNRFQVKGKAFYKRKSKEVNNCFFQELHETNVTDKKEAQRGYVKGLRWRSDNIGLRMNAQVYLT